MAVLAGGSMLRESVTYDEVANLGAGLSYVQKLDLRLNTEHPPLPKIVAAAPLVLRGTRADYSHISWTVSEPFFSAYSGQLYFGEMVLNHWNPPAATLALARLPMLGLTLLLGWIVYVYARRLGGEWGGLLCLCLYVSTPAFLAYGSLVHEDLAIALFSVVTVWTFAELRMHPSRRNMLLFALALAGAFLSKFSAGVLLIALVIAVLSAPGRWKRWGATLAGVAGAALAVYVVYFVFSWNQPAGGGVWARLALPVRLYLRGLYFVILCSSRATFLLGHAYPHGVWFYFPVLLLLKSAPGFLGVLLTAAVAGVARKVPVIPERERLHWRFLWVTLCVFSAVCVMSQLNIGIRHFSVPLVLLILMAAPLPRLLARLWPRVLVAALAASCLATAVLAYPHYLPYHNVLSAGRPAYELFNDSNLDWGQALPDVRVFAEQRGLRQIAVDSYGFTDAAAWTPQARMWNCQSPTDADAGAWVAVSTNMIFDVRNCAWLLRYPHEELGGGSMLAVRLPRPIPAAGTAGGPPLLAAQRSFLEGPGGVDARRWFVDFVHDPEIVSRSTANGARDLSAWSTGWCTRRFPRSPLMRKWIGQLTR